MLCILKYYGLFLHQVAVVATAEAGVITAGAEVTEAAATAAADAKSRQHSANASTHDNKR